MVTDFYKTRKVFDDTIVKQPVTLGNIDFSENFSEQLVDHIYKDKEYFWCDGNPYKSLGEITEGILKGTAPITHQRLYNLTQILKK